MLSEIKGPLGRAINVGTGPQGITVRLQRTQAIGHILAGQYDSAAILCRHLIEGRVRGTFLVQERPGIEQRLGQRRTHIPKSRIGGKQLLQFERTRSDIPVDRKLRQHVGDRHTDRRGRRMQILFGLANIGTLFNEFRGQADGKIRRQGEFIQAEGFHRLVRRQPSEQCGQGVARLTQLFLQRRQRLRRLRFQ